LTGRYGADVLTFAAVALVAFVAMEAVAYATHRWVMHGVGAGWHRSHHRPRRTPFEANDLYPVVMAALTVGLFALGARSAGLHVLTPLALGITAYGAAYLYVHDIAIHRRVPMPVPRGRVMAHLREAHRIHHLWSGEPFGFLLPVVPPALRARAATVDRDPLLATADPAVAPEPLAGGRSSGRQRSRDGRIAAAATVSLRQVGTRARLVKTS
jgi:beta-carotene 3-hydroxylase